MQEYSHTAAKYYDEFEFGQPGDVRFYTEEAVEAGPPVLELACGTGRTLVPIAQAGVEVVGLDLSPEMLDKARNHLRSVGPDTQQRIQLVQADMRTFSLEQRFNLVAIPNRSFLHLLTQDDQRQCLERVRQHLSQGGRLALNIFDPDLEHIVEDYRFPESPLRKHGEFTYPQNGNRVVVWATRKYEPESQIIRQDYIFDEIEASGQVSSRAYSSLTLRYIFRYEMQYLLELSGFRVQALYGDFQRGHFRYGGEQVWVATRR